MENRVNYAFIGIFVIGLLAALIFIGVWLSTEWTGKVYNTYAVYMTESVSGLSLNSTVKYNGVNVGYVKSMRLDPANPQHVCLLLRIENTAPITEATRARLIEQGLTGVSSIELKTTVPHAPRLVAKPGELYPVIKTAPSLFFRLDQAVSNLLTRANKVMDTFDKTFDEQTQRSFHHIVANLDKITTDFAVQTKTLGHTIEEAQTFFKNGSEATTQLTIGLRAFSGETLPQMNQLLLNLNTLSTQFNELGGNLVQNPSILIKGRVSPQKGPGE